MSFEEFISTNVAVLFIIIAVIVLIESSVRTFNPGTNFTNSILIVTAHPDDECMFFGPTISALSANGYRVHLLSLSNGDWYGEGGVREPEFFASCQLLGLNAENCHILNDRHLQDNPSLEWDSPYIQNLVKKFVAEHKISMVITFDEYGVSGHTNHISLYRAISSLQLKDVKKYKLLTVNILRKYSSLTDLLTSRLLSGIHIMTPYSSLHKPYMAMFAHRSQLLWFRYLYILFSRYMFINSLEEIQIGGMNIFK